MSHYELLLTYIQAGAAEKVRAMLAEYPDLCDAHRGGVSYLMLALYAGHPEIAELFEQRPRPLDLHDACALGRAERVAAILRRGPGLSRSFMPDGYGALHLAVLFGRHDIARMLLDAGANPNAVSRNARTVTALEVAIQRHDLAMIHLLLESGADPNQRVSDGRGPLHLVASRGDIQLTQLLVEAGADPARPDVDGETPVEAARAEGYPEIAQWLEARPRSPEQSERVALDEAEEAVLEEMDEAEEEAVAFARAV